MALEKLGNLGQVALMQRLLGRKQSKAIDNESGSLEISLEEYAELESLLEDYRFIMSNLVMYENSLKDDGYKGLVSVIEHIRKKDLH